MSGFDGNIVYVKTDEKDRITGIVSDEYLDDPAGWTEIDRGRGDRYLHARGNYLPETLMNDGGVYVYKLVDGKPVHRTQEEIDADTPAPVPQPSIEEQIAELNAALEALLSGVTDDD